MNGSELGLEGGADPTWLLLLFLFFIFSHFFDFL
jgi:hypothetical protein